MSRVVFRASSRSSSTRLLYAPLMTSSRPSISLRWSVRKPGPSTTLATPKEVEHWSLTTLREKLVKIGAKVVAHGRYVTFHLAEVAVPRDLSTKKSCG